MRNLYLSVLMVLSVHCFGISQPVPCTDTIPDMTPTCLEACIICDIDGFTGRHESSIQGEAPDGFCTFIVHNAQWIAFIAGSEDLVVSLAVSNCQNGLGLEVAIYEALDCENFNLVSNCFGGATTPIGQGQAGQISNTVPLTVGQYYYLVMDGAAGDNCDWTFTVLQGSTLVSPLMSSGQIIGPATSCPEVVEQYTTTGIEGGPSYEWTLNGATISQQDTVDITWSGNGIYELCLTASNACDVAPPTCRTISVSSFPDSFYDEIICAGDCFVLNDTISICDEGLHEYNFVTEAGCDSMVFVNIEVYQEDIVNLSATICDGDTINIGNTPFFTDELHTTVLLNEQGCDSTVTLDLSLIVCEIMGNSTETPVVCNGGNSGEFHFEVIDGTPPFTYNWSQLGSPTNGTGTLAANNTIETISSLSTGTYLITINDNFGNDLILIQDVTEPPVLVGSLDVSNFNGFAVSCFDTTDGSITAIPQGGVSPYNYSWNNAAVLQTIENLSAGDYAVMITDAVGCEINLSQTLLAPMELVLDASFVNPNCDGLSTGFAEILQTTGGIAPYQYDLNGQGFSDNLIFEMLTTGPYTLSAQDANGCITDNMGTLTAPVIPIIDAGEDQSIDLAESTTLSIASNISLDSVVWSPANGLSCTLCPKPLAMPFTSTNYVVAVTSADGCTRTDSVNVEVLIIRDVFVPNVFSPNFDGINDELVIFGGPEVFNIESFQVFDRWGSIVAQKNNFQANDNSGAWDGRIKGSLASNGIYVWTAKIAFIDGVTITYSGDVMVLK